MENKKADKCTNKKMKNKKNTLSKIQKVDKKN